jgi:MFS family permease
VNGGFVAFSVYLPTYLKTAYELSQSDAALRTAGFVIIAVVMRPTGGWLSDRFDPVSVLLVALAGTAVLALVAALEAPLVPLGTVAFLGLAAMLGLGTGGVFALVARLVEPEHVGSVAGVVGAGWFLPAAGDGRRLRSDRGLLAWVRLAGADGIRGVGLHRDRDPEAGPAVPVRRLPLRMVTSAAFKGAKVPDER